MSFVFSSKSFQPPQENMKTLESFISKFISSHIENCYIIIPNELERFLRQQPSFNHKTLLFLQRLKKRCGEAVLGLRNPMVASEAPE